MISLNELLRPRPIALGIIAVTALLIAAQELAGRGQAHIVLNGEERNEKAPTPPDVHRAGGSSDTSAWPRSDVLWTTPLTSLTATTERPIFNPTRHSLPVLTTGSVPSKPTRPPPLALVGAIAAENDSVAIFQNTLTKQIVRLKIGENYAGWVLRSVVGREATLHNGDEEITPAVLPQPATRAAPPQQTK